MSFHELISGYPWLTKRAARMVNEHTETPHRNPFAYFFALFVPFAGRLGGGFSFLIMVYIIGLLAAVAIPAYHDYTIRAKLTVVEAQSAPVRAKLVEFYQSNHRIPDTLQSAGINSTLADGSSLSLDPRGMKLIVATKHGQLIFVPSDAGGRIVWFCTNGEGIKPAQLPMSCRPPATR